MAIALVQSNKGLATTASVAPALPAASTPGNLIVLAFASDDYNGTPDAGWTQSFDMEQQTFHGAYIWWRISTGQTSFQYTIGSATNSAWVLAEFSGCDGSVPYDISDGQFQQSSVGTYSTPAIAPSTGERLLVAMIGQSLSGGVSSAPGSWTNSFTQVQSQQMGGSGTIDGCGMAMRVVTGNGSTTFSTTATWSPVCQSQSGLIISFKAAGGAPTKQITTLGLSGFEHGFIGSGAQNGGGIFDAAPGSGWSASTSSPRNGSYCAHLVAPANTATRLVNNIPSTPTKLVVRFGVKVSSRPSSGTVQLASVWDGVSAQPWILSISSAGVLSMLLSGGSSVNGPTIDTTSWHLIELQFDATADTMDWKVDGALQTRATGTTSAGAEFSLGTRATNQPAYTADFDDVIIGIWVSASVDWYGDGKVLAQQAGVDGTHATITSLSPGDAGTAYSGTPTTVNTMVDDPPGTLGWTTTRSTTDNIGLRTATVGAYAEIKPATTAESGQANAVKALLSYSSSTTTANRAACDVRNSAGAIAELWGLTGGVGQDYSDTANQFKSAIVAAPAAGWTAAEVNAIRWRFGGCTSVDISPVPTCQALMLEVDWPVVSGPTTYFGISALAAVFAKAVAAIRQTFGQTTHGYTFAAVTQGRRKALGAIAAPLTIGIATQGLRKALGATSTTLSFSSTTQAKRRTTSSLVMPIAFTKAVDGKRRTTSNLTFPISFAAVTAGQATAGAVTYFGSTSMAVAYSSTTQGLRRTTSSIVAPFAFAAVTQGKRTARTSLVMPIAFTKAVDAKRKTFSTLAFPITFIKAVAGQSSAGAVTHFGSSAMAVAYGSTTQGVRRTTGVVALPMAFTKAVVGQRKTFGQVVMPVAFTKAVQATRKTFGIVARPSTFTIAAQGRKQTFGSTVQPITFGIATAGYRPAGGAIGATSSVYTFGSTTQARRKTFGVVARPSGFTIAVQGTRKTFGTTARPVTFSAFVAGFRPAGGLLGSVSATFTFGSTTQGRRKTFGVVARPINYLAVTNARRTRFGQVALPIASLFTTVGRRRTFGQVALPSVFASTTTARRKTFTSVAFPITFGAFTISVERAATVINEADMIYLGSQPVDSVYAGAEKVW